MKRTWIIVFAVTTVLTACNKEKFEEEMEGHYTGTFQRISATGLYPSQSVILHLNNNSFSGSSDNARYPAICHGSWEAGASTVDFTNGCVFTADFDWTLILNGSYYYEKTGTHLKIWKKENEVTDTYELEKTD